jgi:hypothetical protein
MVVALPRRRGLPALRLPSWPWRITWTYLGLVLFLPLAGMLLKAAGSICSRPLEPWPAKPPQREP